MKLSGVLRFFKTICVAIVAYSVLLPDVVLATGLGLVPHRAFYTVSLAEGSETGTISAIDGVMSVAMEKTCEGWIYTQSMQMTIQPLEGETILQSAFFSSWESLDGLEYRFVSKTQSNGIPGELRGSASLNIDGSGGSAYYSKPTQTDVDLPEGTLFPVTHTIRLLEEMHLGTRYFSRVVFTGSEDLKPEYVNAFIGDVVPPEKHGAGRLGKLGEQSGWPLSLAFFPLVSDSGIPTLELQVLQLDNGISSDMVMKFSNFSADIIAQKFEVIDWPDC